jgi:hypothetical protein
MLRSSTVITVTYSVSPHSIADTNNLICKINYVDFTINGIKASGVNSVTDATPMKLLYQTYFRQ